MIDEVLRGLRPSLRWCPLPGPGGYGYYVKLGIHI